MHVAANFKRRLEFKQTRLRQEDFSASQSKTQKFVSHRAFQNVQFITTLVETGGKQSPPLGPQTVYPYEHCAHPLGPPRRAHVIQTNHIMDASTTPPPRATRDAPRITKRCDKIQPFVRTRQTRSPRSTLDAFVNPNLDFESLTRAHFPQGSRVRARME